MNYEEPVSQTFCDTVTKNIQTYFESISHFFTFGHPIHPLEPITSQFSEYILLNNQRRLRIIHINPNKITPKNEFTNNCRNRTSCNSLSEEYWFTRWNKPLKLGNCNCSFRRSQRFSTLSNQPLPLSLYVPINIANNIRTSDLSNYEVPPIKIVNVETFVERLIQETLFEAFQEYFMQKPVTNGTINLGFLNNEDEVDGVVLRKFNPTAKENKRKSNSNSIDNTVMNCMHGNSRKKKPTVILLHGIGGSAEIWWNVMNTLVYKGYEVVAPDMLGHGYSSVPDSRKAYTFDNLLKYTLAVFDHYVGCDESKNCIIIGHSYGCSLATALCRYRSEQIIQLILISGGGPTPLAAPVVDDEQSMVNCLQTALKPLLLCGVKRTMFYSLRGKHFDVCTDNNGVPNYVLDYIINGQNWPEGDAAFHRRILIPTLLVHGLQDTHITLVQECEMERTIPRAFLELIPNAGHMCMLETPEHLSHMIMCFIDWWTR